MLPSRLKIDFTGTTPAGGRISRRDLLGALSIAGGGLCLGLDRISIPSIFPRGLDQWRDPFAGGELIGTVPFAREGRIEMETLVGRELDSRLYTDLARLGPEKSTVPTERFYVRTRASELLEPGNLRSFELRGLAGKPIRVQADALEGKSQPMGGHLMECAGNTRDGRFGLMSVAEWAGVPLLDVLDRVSSPAPAPPAERAARILVSGFDRYASESLSSTPGASWIFSRSDLERAKPFLALEMNGKPLTRDHGAPIRLVMPGWYGCTCIKWVNEIRLVPNDAECTSQMQEFAQRTHQRGVPKRAADYEPAIIDQAAMPIRVEKWRVGASIKYRVVGILWGGSAPVKRLEIRFNPDEEYVAVDDVRQSSNDPWSFWSHAWSPARPGTYLLRLKVADPGVRTRRLDMGFYVRAVEISEI